MADYDGLPLMTPTKVREDATTEVWATRTPNGGTSEFRPKPGSPAANLATLQARAQAALASNATFLAIASPTAAQVATQSKALTRQVDGIIRQLLGLVDTITDS